MKGLAALCAGLLGLLLFAAGCGDIPVGKPCKDNHDCTAGLMKGQCMGSVMSASYCTTTCEKDADCKNPDYVCGTAEVTRKGLLGDDKKEAHYCTKKVSDVQKSLQDAVKKPPAKK